MDERIFNTFNAVKVNVRYERLEDKEKPYFSIEFNIELKDASIRLSEIDWTFQEDVIYLLDVVLREFAIVLRGYHFEDYVNFKISNVQNPVVTILEKPSLELFRRGKIDITTLLHPAMAATLT